MHTYIALFRGINVGGKNSLLMKELVALLENIGAQKVRTYIQSGNAVFQSAEENPLQLAGQISAAIRKGHGFEPRVLILRLDELIQAMTDNPFPEAEAEPNSLHLGFLGNRSEASDFEKLNSLKTATERFHLTDTVFYLHAPEGIGRSKLAANAEKLLGVAMTVRNWRTVFKVREMAEDLS
jgi:uncharacterized protein (DUF1697 family)